MKILKLILFLLLAIGAHATDVQIKLTDARFNVGPFANRPIWIRYQNSPNSYGEAVALYTIIQTNTDSAGSFILSNAVPGLYLVTVQAPPQRADFNFVVINNSLGLIQAADYLVVTKANSYVYANNVLKITSVDGSVTLNPTNGVGVVDLSTIGGITGGTNFIPLNFGTGTNTQIVVTDRVDHVWIFNGINWQDTTAGGLPQIQLLGNSYTVNLPTVFSEGAPAGGPQVVISEGINQGQDVFQVHSNGTTIDWIDQSGIYHGDGSGLTNLASQVWTNDGTFIYPSGTGPRPPILIRKDGSIFYGTNVNLNQNLNSLTVMRPLSADNYIASNQPPFQINVRHIDNANFDWFSGWGLTVIGNDTTPQATLSLEAKGTNVDNLVILDATPNANRINVSSSGSDKFTVSSVGDLTKIKGVQYSWPATNGLPGQGIVTDGNTPQQLSFGNFLTGSDRLWTNRSWASPYGSQPSIQPVDGSRTVNIGVTGQVSSAINSVLKDTNTAHTFTIGAYFGNNSTQSLGGSLYYGQSISDGGVYAALGECFASAAAMLGGDGVGLLGVADSFFSKQHGVQGFAWAQANNQTNFGGQFSASSNGKTGAKAIGLYAETTDQSPGSISDVAPAGSAAIVLDNRESGRDLILATTNNGGAKVFRLSGLGDLVIPGGDGQGKVLIESDGQGTARWSSDTLTNIVYALAVTNGTQTLTISNIFVNNAYITNLYSSNAFITNLTVQFLTNITEFHGKTTITTNLFVTNLYAFNGQITNLTVLGNQTNEAMTPNTIAAWGPGRNLTNVPNAIGVLTNDGNGNFSWVTVGGAGGGAGWLLTGNSGTDPTVNFLGTTDDKDFIIKSKNHQVGQFTTENIGGHSVILGYQNSMTSGGVGGSDFIGSGNNNVIDQDVTFSSISAGQSNLISGETKWGSIIGGERNTVTNDYAIAGGHRANTGHKGVFVWADSQESDFKDSASNTFNIRAQNGVQITGQLYADGITNGGGTASTIAIHDSHTPPKILGFANGSGALTNDGSGNFGWFSGFGTGVGSVTSVGMTGDGTVFNSSVGGSPVTTSGTLAPTLVNVRSNKFLAGPINNGADAAPTFRLLDVSDFNSGTGASAGSVWLGNGTWGALPNGPYIQSAGNQTTLGFGTNTAFKGLLETNDATGNFEVATNGVITVVRSNNIDSSVVYALDLTNNSIASSGHQRYSPAWRLTANGWKTQSTASNQPVMFRGYVIPQQQTTEPSGYYHMESSTNKDNTQWGQYFDYDYNGNQTNAGPFFMFGMNGQAIPHCGLVYGQASGGNHIQTYYDGDNIFADVGGPSALGQFVITIGANGTYYNFGPSGMIPRTGQGLYFSTQSTPWLNGWTRDIFGTNSAGPSKGFWMITNGGWGPLVYFGTNHAVSTANDAINTTNQFEIDVPGVSPAFCITTNGTAYFSNALPDVQIFTTKGPATWTKPNNVKTVKVICVGGGGGGAGGFAAATNTGSLGGTGGSGASYCWGQFLASDLTATVSITVGGGGPGGGAGAAGTVGTNSTFGSYLTGYGGTGGQQGASAGGTARGGPGGAGTAGTGAAGSTSGGAGGSPGGSSASAIGGQGSAGVAGGNGGGAEYGGGGSGGYNIAGSVVGSGGSSLWGAGAGGCGGAFTSGAVMTSGAAGGASQSYAPGGGGSGASSGGTGGTGASVAGQLIHCGAGGGGGGANTDSALNGGPGGPGGQPGGGGGGGGACATGKTAGSGGNGGDGQVIVISW